MGDSWEANRWSPLFSQYL